MARKWIVIALVLVMLVSGAALLNLNPIDPMDSLARLPAEEGDETPPDPSAASAEGGNGRLRLMLTETGHFYDGSIEVGIVASSADAKIYYTINGAEPTSASREYSSPLRLLAPIRSGVNVVTVKAIAVLDDVTTRALAHTYFIGSDVETRFDTLIFSVSTDPEYLYDYDTGIFVAGRERDDYIAENPGRHINPPDPANFNWRGMAGERPASIEVFTPDGRRVVVQAAGIRVHGGWSRAAEQKSIRMIARREYEPDAGRFHFDFFPNDVKANVFGAPITRYDQLVLRNGANDRDFGMLRHETGTQLARMAGFRVTPDVCPAAVFVNGEYYGFAWLQSHINEQYLEDIFDAPTREFQIVGDGELWIVTDNQAEREAIEHLHSYIWRDLTNDRIFAEFEELVDVDDLLLFYAIQTYLGNNDWPGGNMKRWRYTGPQTEGLAPELDGRWRHVLYDMDWILGLYETPSNPNKPTFQEMMNPNSNRFSHMLNALFKRRDMADKFSMIMCDLAANIITPDNVRDTVSRLYAEASGEIDAALGANKYAHWVSRYSVEENHDNMLRFAEGRAAYMHRSLREHFGYGYDMFDVNVTGGAAVIGTQPGASSRYFAHLTVPLRPDLPKFTVFDHWVVNGARIYEPHITVSAADARSGAVNVELVTREEFPPLAFSEAYASSERSGCVLVNLTEESARADGLYLSNDINNPFLWALPNASVPPGGTLGLAGRNGAGAGDLMLIQTDISVRSGRMLYLSDADGTILDAIAVP